MITKEIKVVKIINEQAIVINVGANYKVKQGDIFEIYDPGTEVIDPDTKESLGTLDYIKATVEVTTVYDLMSVCRNVEEKTFSLLSSISLQKTYRETLNVATDEISGDFTDKTAKIHIGDLVREAKGYPTNL